MGETNPRKDMKKVVASIEARMGSTRLPGKVLADLGNVSVLSLLLKRLRHCDTLDHIVLATSTSQSDDVLESWAREENVDIFRGSESDVLKRVVQAHAQYKSDVVVGITGDCPFMDPDIIDMGVQTFLANDCDVLSTKGSFPIGIDNVVYKFSCLAENSKTISDPMVREHVGYYILRHPELYRTFTLVAPKRWNYPNHRYVLDYPEDLHFLQRLYSRLYPSHGSLFSFDDILEIVHTEPTLLNLNSMHVPAL